MSVNIKGMKKYHRSDKPEKKSLKCKIGIDESLFSLGVNNTNNILILQFTKVRKWVVKWPG